MGRAIRVLALAPSVAGSAGGCDDEDHVRRRSDCHETADRICLYSDLRPKAVPNDMAQAARLLGEEARLRAAVERKLRPLAAPADLARDYERFLRLSAEVADALRRMSAVARRGERARLAELGRRAGLVEAERQRLAERIGFRRCGRPITRLPAAGGSGAARAARPRS